MTNVKNKNNRINSLKVIGSINEIIKSSHLIDSIFDTIKTKIIVSYENNNQTDMYISIILSITILYLLKKHKVNLSYDEIIDLDLFIKNFKNNKYGLY